MIVNPFAWAGTRNKKKAMQGHWTSFLNCQSSVAPTSMLLSAEQSTSLTQVRCRLHVPSVLVCLRICSTRLTGGVDVWHRKSSSHQLLQKFRLSWDARGDWIVLRTFFCSKSSAVVFGIWLQNHIDNDYFVDSCIYFDVETTYKFEIKSSRNYQLKLRNIYLLFLGFINLVFAQHA